MQSIVYEVSPLDPADHLFHIRCHIPEPAAEGQQVSMPAWIPGSYLIRDFAKNIVKINASSGGEPVAMRPLDKDSWQCDPCKQELLIEYQVYAGDNSVRGAKLETTKGFFNGTSVFLRVHGCEQNICKMILQAPISESAAKWKVVTAMPAFEINARGFGEYRARDYDELIDHPVAMGRFVLGKFVADGVPHEIALFGRHHADINRLCADLRCICEQHIHFFRDKAPVYYYLFIVIVVGSEGYGGLEHRASTALICSRDHLPHTSRPGMDDLYREFLGLCSHEYFHTWNIKRIKPAAFIPVDYQKENYTELLWVFEGITSYYDDLALLHSGLIDSKNYLELLGQMITRVLRGKGRLRQTIAESSYYAWTKFYKPDENSTNAVVSYYAKGALIALGLDFMIRSNTRNEYSLDDVMFELWSNYGKTGKGVAETDFETLACQVGGDELKRFFDHAVRSTEDLPLQEWLSGYGVKMNLRASESSSDKGGKPLSKVPQAEMGITLKEESGLVRVIAVGEGTPAQKAGVWAGDLIIACNGLKAGTKRIATELAYAEPGDQFILHVFRGDELLVFHPILRAPEQTTCYLEFIQDASEDQKAARAAWLKSE
ncbi:MAG: M61 family metallopeptidase [Gammaproteobacteria bacterium]|nr:M61 family metallopeptidase [Gammaproteobacteria bacterium]